MLPGLRSPWIQLCECRKLTPSKASWNSSARDGVSRGSLFDCG